MCVSYTYLYETQAQIEGSHWSKYSLLVLSNTQRVWVDLCVERSHLDVEPLQKMFQTRNHFKKYAHRPSLIWEINFTSSKSIFGVFYLSGQFLMYWHIIFDTFLFEVHSHLYIPKMPTCLSRCPCKSTLWHYTVIYSTMCLSSGLSTLRHWAWVSRLDTISHALTPSM